MPSFLHALFAWRYFRARKSTNAINIIAWVCIAAIIVGAAALILVLSVFNGFESLVKSLYANFYTDLRIVPKSGKVMVLDSIQLQRIAAVTGIRNMSQVVEEKAILQNGDAQTVVMLKGVDEQYAYTTTVPDRIVAGTFDLGNDDAPSIVLGAGVENAAGIQSDRALGEVLVYLPKRNQPFKPGNELDAISVDSILPTGAFVIQQDFDNRYGITNLDFMRRMLSMQANELGALEISLKNPDEGEQVQQSLQQLLGSNYIVQTRFEQNKSLYGIMQAEKWFIYALLSLILVVAAFTIIGSLTMFALEKAKDMAVLHALGASRIFIRNIFIAEGLLLAVIGGLAGMGLAAVLALAQVKFKLIPLQGGSFLIDYFPVELHIADFALVGITVLGISLLASIIPASKAAGREYRLRAE